MAGQPTKYKKEYNEQARKLCLLGYTDAQLADFFNVTETTINNWKIQEPSFFESLKAGKAVADGDIVESLYNRARGCSHTETKVVSTQNGIELVNVDKHYPPDPTSMIFWLKNRQPDKWRDKQEVEQTSTVHNIMPVPVASSTDEWETAANANQDGLLNRGK